MPAVISLVWLTAMAHLDRPKAISLINFDHAARNYGCELARSQTIEPGKKREIWEVGQYGTAR
jgi:hypothetical protein